MNSDSHVSRWLERKRKLLLEPVRPPGESSERHKEVWEIPAIP